MFACNQIFLNKANRKAFHWNNDHGNGIPSSLLTMAHDGMNIMEILGIQLSISMLKIIEIVESFCPHWCSLFPPPPSNISVRLSSRTVASPLRCLQIMIEGISFHYGWHNEEVAHPFRARQPPNGIKSNFLRFAKPIFPLLTLGCIALHFSCLLNLDVKFIHLVFHSDELRIIFPCLY